MFDLPENLYKKANTLGLIKNIQYLNLQCKFENIINILYLF